MTTASASQPVTRPTGEPGRSPRSSSPAAAVERPDVAAVPAGGGLRPPLRVVDPRRDRSPRNAAGLVGTVLAGVLFASVFSVVICQVLLVQTQSRLDDLDRRIDQQVSEGKQLRHDIAGLESPERIVGEATRRLDMVSSSEVGYLQPRADDDTRAALTAGAPAPDAAGGR